MSTSDRALREAIIAACLRMEATGLTQGTSGNISMRHGDTMLITPSATAYDEMTPEMIAAVSLDRAAASVGPRKPSTEWRFHHDILRARPEAQAVVHTHSPYATALSMTRNAIPPAHYMIAAFGGADVRCADYALFGTQALSDNVLSALSGRNACLLANHGAVTLAASLERAMWLAQELETLAKQYVLSLSAGGPVLLSEAEIAEALEAFKGYRPID